MHYYLFGHSFVLSLLQLPYCPFFETLVPETNYVCVVYIRQKKEENKISDAGGMVTSEMESEFALEIPAGSFEGETTLSLQVIVLLRFVYAINMCA